MDGAQLACDTRGHVFESSRGVIFLLLNIWKFSQFKVKWLQTVRGKVLWKKIQNAVIL